MKAAMRDALLLCAGMLIGFGLWAALPAPEPRVERIYVPHHQTKTVAVEVPKACPKPFKDRCEAPRGIQPSLVLRIVRECRAGTLDLSTPDFAILSGEAK